MNEEGRFRGVFFALIALTGCIATPQYDVTNSVEWGDTDLYPEPGGAYATLTPLSGTCTFVPGTGVMTIDPNDTAQTIIFGKRTVDSAILINGDTCGSPAATSLTLKKLTFGTHVANDQIVIIDYLNGIFAPGTAAGRGVVIDLGAGSGDALRIRGTLGADNITFGASGISINTDLNRDMDVAGIETFSVSMAAGLDSFSAGGMAYGTGGVFTDGVTVFGGPEADTLTGGSGADALRGGDGNDTLSGGLGNDALYGDDGADTFNEGATANGADVFVGGLGSDTVSYASRTAAVRITIDADDGAMVPAEDDGESNEKDDVRDGIEIISGGSGADTLIGDENANTLNGNGGADTLAGGGAADTLNGGDGNDTFDEGADPNGGDIFNGGAGTDILDYADRDGDLTVTMDGVAANDGEALEADNAKSDIETIYGGSGDDTLTGNGFSNTLRGGAGADILSGGSGDDTFDEEDESNGADIFNGGPGEDVVDYTDRGESLTVTMDGAAANDGETNEGDNVKADIENLIGGSEDDTLVGNALDNDIRGKDGDDTLNGGAGNDSIDGNAGNDTLYGAAGEDTLDGGTGNNSGSCGDGDDQAFNKGTGCWMSDCEFGGQPNCTL